MKHSTIFLVPMLIGITFGTSHAQTSGFSGSGMTDSEFEMMKVRQAAQQAQGAAAAASMSRSADEALEKQQYERTLNDAREIKRLKQQAMEQQRWDNAQAAQNNNRVSSSDLSSWNGPGGGVRVERSVPTEFTMNVARQELAELKAQQSSRKRGLFGRKKSQPDPNIPITSITTPSVSAPTVSAQVPAAPVVSAPQVQMQMPPAPAPERGLKKLLPKKPSFKIGRDKPTADLPPQPTFAAPAVAAPAVTAPPAVTAAVEAPLTKITETRSAADMLKQTGEQTTQSVTQTVNNAAYSASGAVEEKKKSLFGIGKKASNSEPSNSRSGGFLGFGKKKQATTQGLDASLFPEGSAQQAQGGTPMAPSYGTPAGVSQVSSSSGMTLPGTQPPAKEKKLFGKPKISKPQVVAGSTSPTSVINRNGNSFYVTQSNTQFMKYGATVNSTTILALPPGTIVQMTKPGQNWATVMMPDGSTGVIEVKSLRAANPGESW